MYGEGWSGEREREKGELGRKFEMWPKPLSGGREIYESSLDLIINYRTVERR